MSMMLQKLLQRSRSFRRNSKESSTTKSGVTGTKDDVLVRNGVCITVDGTKSLDRGALMMKSGSNLLEDTRLVTKIDAVREEECSADSSIGGRKVVTFRADTKNASASRGCAASGLFDGDVMQAFQTGDLTIAEFLQSPLTSPPVAQHRRSSQSERPASPSGSGSSTASSSRTTDREVVAVESALPCSRKKLTLLDKAHSQASIGHRLDLHDQMTESRLPEGDFKSRANDDSRVSYLSSDKPRFSKSLEHLAQEVFGDEFEHYLETASKSPVKVSVAGLSSRGELPANYATAATCKSANMRGEASDVPSSDKRVITYNGKADRPRLVRQSIAPSHGDKDLKAKMDHETEALKSVEYSDAIVIPDRLSTDVGEAVEDDCVCSADMRSPGHDGDLHEIPKKLGVSLTQALSKRAECTASRATAKKEPIIRNDSLQVHRGSYSDCEIDCADVEIQFPPPPPVDEALMAGKCSPVGTPVSLVDWDFRLSQISTRTGSSLCCRDHQDWCDSQPECDKDADSQSHSDPLVDSLMALVPLPEENTATSMSKALSEVISEIVASRRKIRRLTAATQIHQRVLKAQNGHIEQLSKEVTELRRTAYAINNYQAVLRSGKSPVPDGGSAHRQSREMVELNYTLDKLLHQCSALQRISHLDHRCSAADSDTGGLEHENSAHRELLQDEALNERTARVQRANSCPSRHLFDRATNEPL